MGLFNLFKKKSKIADPLKDYILPNLKVGYFVDFEMKTWKVHTKNCYCWEQDDYTYEWQLKSHDETIYLEHESDDENYFSISKKISITSINGNIVEHIKKHKDPPSQIIFEDTKYHLEETAGGQFYKNCDGIGKELLRWDYADDSSKKIVSVEQWGENDFETSAGVCVEEYQFTNILPG